MQNSSSNKSNVSDNLCPVFSVMLVPGVVTIPPLKCFLNEKHSLLDAPKIPEGSETAQAFSTAFHPIRVMKSLSETVGA